ncbi:hypothetical protein N9S30_00690 [bacterium]|nr:hypothetical protein [bacterium]
MNDNADRFRQPHRTTMETLVTPIQLRDHAVLLLAWWALWSLADFYLIKYSPVSELVVLLLALSLYAPEWLQLLSNARAKQRKLVATHLERL